MSKLYFGGPILTMEPGLNPTALLTSPDGKTIEAVGDLEDLWGVDPNAQLVDLEGRTMLPAFLDPHSHLAAMATTVSLAQLITAESFRDIASILRHFVVDHEVQPGEWVVGTGYDQDLLDEGVHPTRQLLDTALADFPCLITHASGHMGVANSRALAIMGIDADTPDPDGGKIGREPDGKTPNGYLEENAFIRLATPAVPRTTPEKALNDLRYAQKKYISQGFVLAQDGMTGQAEYDLLAAGARADLPLEVVGYADLNNAPQLADMPPIGRFSMGGYKMFLDGSPQGRTAWMSKPYAKSGDYRGYPAWSDEKVIENISLALTKGRQLLAHCNGDAAAEQYMECFEKALIRTGVGDTHRPVMIHAQLVRRDQLERMSALGMIPSFFAAHLWYWGDTHLKNFGEERADHISPLGWAQELNLPFTLHQDSPVIEPNALESVWCAVARTTRSGRVLGSDLSVTAEQALKAFTRHAAYQYGMEKTRGTLVPGKRAEFVLLDADPTAVDPRQLRRIRVLETIREDEVLYQA